MGLQDDGLPCSVLIQYHSSILFRMKISANHQNRSPNQSCHGSEHSLQCHELLLWILGHQADNILHLPKPCRQSAEGRRPHPRSRIGFTRPLPCFNDENRVISFRGHLRLPEPQPPSRTARPVRAGRFAPAGIRNRTTMCFFRMRSTLFPDGACATGSSVLVARAGDRPPLGLSFLMNFSFFGFES